MSSSIGSTQGTPATLRPSRPYQTIVLYWEAHKGINGDGEGGLATRKQLQDALAESLQKRTAPSAEGILSSLVPGVVVQLADGLYWLSQDWQVLCL